LALLLTGEESRPGATKANKRKTVGKGVSSYALQGCSLIRIASQGHSHLTFIATSATPKVLSAPPVKNWRDLFQRFGKNTSLAFYVSRPAPIHLRASEHCTFFKLNYVKGGYHPVKIGDTFSDERYIVICKLKVCLSLAFLNYIYDIIRMTCRPQICQICSTVHRNGTRRDRSNSSSVRVSSPHLFRQSHRPLHIPTLPRLDVAGTKHHDQSPST
jgi:hypothetical protein